MRLHRYLGCVYDIFFEEVNIRFLVHKRLIGKETREQLLFYVMTGRLPEGIKANTEENIIRFSPLEERDTTVLFKEEDYLWFVL